MAPHVRSRPARLIALALVASCATWTATGSVYRSPCQHWGVRPSSDALDEWAITVQYSREWGPCTMTDGGAKP